MQTLDEKLTEIWREVTAKYYQTPNSVSAATLEALRRAYELGRTETKD